MRDVPVSRGNTYPASGIAELDNALAGVVGEISVTARDLQRHVSAVGIINGDSDIRIAGGAAGEADRGGVLPDTAVGGKREESRRRASDRIRRALCGDSILPGIAGLFVDFEGFTFFMRQAMNVNAHTIFNF